MLTDRCAHSTIHIFTVDILKVVNTTDGYLDTAASIGLASDRSTPTHTLLPTRTCTPPTMLVLYLHPPRLPLRGTGDSENHPISIISSKSLACVQYCLLLYRQPQTPILSNLADVIIFPGWCTTACCMPCGARRSVAHGVVNQHSGPTKRRRR